LSAVNVTGPDMVTAGSLVVGVMVTSFVGIVSRTT
jgi:hypothetical protein